MARSRMRTPLSVEIECLEELIEKSYAYLWHFAITREKEIQRIAPHLSIDTSWQTLKHQKQKQLHRECVARCLEEPSRTLGRIWEKRANKLYAEGDFGGLIQLLQKIENQNLEPTDYAELLKQRNMSLQDEINELRESARQIRISSVKQPKAYESRAI